MQKTLSEELRDIALILKNYNILDRRRILNALLELYA